MLELDTIENQGVEIKKLKAEIKRLKRARIGGYKTIRALQDVAEALKRCGNCKHWNVCGCKKTNNYYDRSSAASDCEHWELLRNQSAKCKEYRW